MVPCHDDAEDSFEDAIVRSLFALVGSCDPLNSSRTVVVGPTPVGAAGALVCDGGKDHRESESELKAHCRAESLLTQSSSFSCHEPQHSEPYRD